MSYKIKVISDPITEGDTTYQEISPIVGEGRNTSISTYPWDFSFNEGDNTYTSSWNSGKHAGTFTQGNYLYNNVMDALSKWKSGNASIPYFAVNTPSGIKYYKILFLRPAALVTEEPAEAEKQIVNVATPVKRKVIPSKRGATKLYTPITGEAANYLDHVSGGVPYFILPEGYTNDDFQDALSIIKLREPEVLKLEWGDYQDTESQLNNALNSPQENTQETERSTQIKLPSRKKGSFAKNLFRKHTNETAAESADLLNKAYMLYAYPHRQVDIYSIHPDIYEKVLLEFKKMDKSSDDSSYLRTYILTPKSLQKVPIGAEVNDSIYHTISSNGKDWEQSQPALENSNILAPGDVLIKYAIGRNGLLSNGVLVDKRTVKNGKVPSFTIKGGTGALSAMAGEGINWVLPAIKIKSSPSPNRSEWFTMDDGIKLVAQLENQTPEQRLQLMNRTLASLRHNISSESLPYDSLFNYIPQENILVDYKKPYELQEGIEKRVSDIKNIVSSFKEDAQKGVNKVKSWFGFKEGGIINYLNYFK